MSLHPWCLRRKGEIKLFAHLTIFICQASFLSSYLPSPASIALIFLWLKNKTMGWLLQQYHLFVFFKQPATQPEDNGHLIYSSSEWSYLIPCDSCLPHISIANKFYNGLLLNMIQLCVVCMEAGYGPSIYSNISANCCSLHCSHLSWLFTIMLSLNYTELPTLSNKIKRNESNLKKQLLGI